jgi:triphosphatase
MRELELKFQVPPGVLQALRREMLLRGARSIRLIARYFDTPDGRLSEHRLALRLRKEGRRWFQTLKASGDASIERLEHNVPLRVPAGGVPQLDLMRHEGTEPGARLRDLLGDAWPGGLVERFSTDVVRLAGTFSWPGSSVEAALDVGTIQSDGRSVPICELELEHLSGGLDELFELGRQWGGHGGLWLDIRPKSRRGDLLARDLVHGSPMKARPPGLEEGLDGDRFVRAVVHAALDQVIGNASEIAAGSPDEDHVHQLRVGLRRLRTALRELGPLARGIPAHWESMLAAHFGRLGAIRDDETVAQAVRPLLEQAGAPNLQWVSASDRGSAAAIVRAPDFQRAMLDVLQWAMQAPEDPGAVSSKEVQAHVRDRLSRLHRQVAQGARHFESLPVDEQHRLRKRLKRLRYLSEFVVSRWSGKAARRYLRRLEPAQDALGRHNDVVVAGDKFRADAQQDALSLFAAGYLLAHRAVTARLARVALEPLRGAARFWKGAGSF